MINYPTSKCVRCGYCCKRAACPFGEYDHKKNKCKFLIKRGKKYACKIYKKILKSPGSDYSPAFGAGCCSPLNPDRRKIINGN